MNSLAKGGRDMNMLFAFILTCRYELLKIYGDGDNWTLVKLSLPMDHDDRVGYEDGVQDVPALYDKRMEPSAFLLLSAEADKLSCNFPSENKVFKTTQEIVNEELN